MLIYKYQKPYIYYVQQLLLTSEISIWHRSSMNQKLRMHPVVGRYISNKHMTISQTII